MSEWKFKRDTTFRKQFFVPDSFAHPATMDAQLLIRIVEEYTKAGETILDPMAGSGTTMLACMLGRGVILVELEEKFIKMCEANWEQVKMRPQLGYEMGTCQIIQGDARQLSNILCDKIITSPPYIAQTSISEQTEGLFKGRKLFENGRDPQQHSEGQIGDLPYGQLEGLLVDKCIFSPPYAETITQGGETGAHKDKYGYQGKNIGYTEKEDNIGNLPYGNIDSIITSPPYAETGIGDWKTGRDEFQAWVIEQLETKGYIQWQGKRYTESEWRAMNYGRLDGRTTKGVRKQATDGYGKRGGQIGNLKSDTYLQAMLQVYQQCYKVLKPQGLMILVVKNFIRNQREVDLKGDTIKLCQQAGFSFIEEHHRILPAQSFWRVIYRQKYPDAPEIDREYILIFAK